MHLHHIILLASSIAIWQKNYQWAPHHNLAIINFLFNLILWAPRSSNNTFCIIVTKSPITMFCTTSLLHLKKHQHTLSFFLSFTCIWCTASLLHERRNYNMNFFSLPTMQAPFIKKIIFIACTCYNAWTFFFTCYTWLLQFKLVVWKTKL